ncbi:MAG: divergent PAP2 family protein [Caryophanon sp.]|nr:divergent PAP2 family protein [Caryophanon sp.]
MELLTNKPLLLALACVLIAQLLKVPIHYALTRTFDMKLLNSTGGMPSSHSAAVCALATAVGFETGLGSPVFAVAAMFAIIVMYDATHVRYEAGQHAASINDIYKQLSQLFDDLRTVNDETRDAVIREDLKTLLGHKKSEVYAGCVTGIVVSTLFYTFS